VQFIGKKPIFIDTLSFKKYEVGEPWEGYKQFCEHFLAPLALAHYASYDVLKFLETNIEGIPLEAELGRHVLFVRNYDKPGFIGALGQALAAAEVNIATFHLGRTAPGEDAIALVEVDQKLTPKLLETVRRLPNVIQAKAMRF